MTVFKSAAVAAVFGALCGLALAPQVVAQGAATVSIASFKFNPETVTAAPNAAITWTNTDGAPHQIVVAAKNLKTPVINKGQSEQLKIADAGSYDYICGIHPSMKGKIVIK